MTSILLLFLSTPGPWVPASVAPDLSRALLEAHNAVRALVEVPPLEWSSRLAADAQQWANRLASTGAFRHRADCPFGENLYEIRGATARPQEVVAGWAGESSLYDYASNTCRGVCGHYTQIVWKTTHRLGCGVARAAAREIWVCEYDPPGNYRGRRPY